MKNSIIYSTNWLVILLLALLLSSVSGWGQITPGKFRYIEDNTFTNITRVEEVYGRNLPWGDPTAPPPPQTLMTRVLLPAGDNERRRPLIILLHGGMLVDTQTTRIFDSRKPTPGSPADRWLDTLGYRLARRGYVVAIPTFRIGWNNFAETEAGLVKEFYEALWRAQQDYRALVRFFAKDAANANSIYRVDTERMVAWGAGSGALIPMFSQFLDKPAEYNSLAINRLIDQRRLGNADGVIPGLRPQGSSLDASFLSFSPKVQTIVAMNGFLQDTSLIEAGDIPILGIRNPLDTLYRNHDFDLFNRVTGRRFLEVFGMESILLRANHRQNQTVLKNSFFPKESLPGYVELNARGDEFFNWWDAMDSRQPRAYLDTILIYTLPRLCYTLNLASCKHRLVNRPASNFTAAISVYPNPVGSRLRLDVGQALPPQTVRIYNSFGQTITRPLENNTVNVADLPDGLYWIELSGYELIKFVKSGN